MESIILKNFAKPTKEGKYYLNWSNCRNFISKKWDKLSKLENSVIRFDLEGFDFINLDGLIWLLLIGEILHNNNYLILNLPRDKQLLKYMKSVGFHQIAAEIFDIYPKFYIEEVEEYKLSKGIRIEKVSSVNLQNVQKNFHRFIESKDFYKMLNIAYTGQISWEYIPYLVLIISELLSNIVEHSGKTLNTGEGYAGMFVSGQKINIIVADAGVGFTKGLKRKEIIVKSSEEAIKKAFLFRYYKNKTKVEGKGIFEALKCIRKLGGSVRIGSENAEGNLSMKGRLYEEKNEDEKLKQIIEKELKSYSRRYFPGVQYSILLDLPERRNCS